jgi:hypothetical protein
VGEGESELEGVVVGVREAVGDEERVVQGVTDGWQLSTRMRVT